MTDILAIGAHPDDIELSCAGTLLREMKKGKKVSILDLSKGELGTRGNGETRMHEASVAAEILGIDGRINLEFKDGFFTEDELHIREVVKIIRLLKPEIVLCNAVEDRHPDHGRAASLIAKSCFYSGLVKFQTEYKGMKQEVHRPKAVYNYIQFKYIKPDFLVDISEFYDTKMKSIQAYSSQFYNPDSKEPETMISSKGFLDFIEARMIEYGRILGVKYAEGYTASRIPGVESLFDLK